jgi:hypothetical protein
MTVLPGYLLMNSSGANGLEIAILDINKREVVRRIPYNTDPKVAAQRTAEEIRRLGQLKVQNSSGDFIESRALDVRRRLLPCVFSEGPDPVSRNMAEWTASDVRLLLDILRTAGDSEYLMHYGALKGNFLFPDRENVVVARIGHTLVYRSALGERVHWQQI